MERLLWIITESCTDFKSNSQVGVLTKKWEACPNELNYHALEWRKRKQVKLCSAGQHLNCRCRSSPGINQLQWSQIDLYLLRIWDSIVINSRSMLILERKREKYFNIYNLYNVIQSLSHCNGCISHGGFWAIISFGTNIERKIIEAGLWCRTLSLQVHKGYDVKHKRSSKSIQYKE